MEKMPTPQTKEEIMALPIEFEKKEVPIEKDSTPTELGKLFEALAKAQLEMEVAKTDSINPYFKSRYADLASIVKASRSFLAKNGLSIIQRTITKENGDVFLYTRLCHSSGQWIESNMAVKPPKADIQTLGSYLTYLRRYMYAAVTGVVAGDEDDDGEVAMVQQRKESDISPENAKISKAQLQVLSNELSSFPELLENLLKGFSIQKISDLKARHYSKCIDRIREIKRAKEA